MIITFLKNLWENIKYYCLCTVSSHKYEHKNVYDEAGHKRESISFVDDTFFKIKNKK